MIKRDYYDLLGIDSSATLEEVKKAYRRLAYQYHPDKNPNNPRAEEHFKLITEAYETLHNTQKRAVYDRHGPSIGPRGFEGFREPPDYPSRKDFFEDIFDEILKDFFRTKPPSPKKARGADLRYNLEISLEEAAFGSEQKIHFARKSVCPHCHGSRCAPGTGPAACPTCEGYGSFRSQRGFFMVETACERCKGEGEIIPRPCPRCGGLGSLRVPQIFKIQTPPGADHGTRLRLAGEGEMGKNGGSSGDLYVVLSLAKHPIFSRQGKNLFCDIPIRLSQALKGAELDVPTLKGKVRIRVPAKTPPGKVFILKGLGMPILQGKGRGDLRVRVRVEIPNRASRRDREMLNELNRLGKKGKTDEDEASFLSAEK
jgi:molecular chaperone DnaJ